ncbi:Multidrug resistance-associated protein [Blattamonas nauphoetae]|uniref:Multidrug resistance-associated protein n=1 Tax=Blattamonas nauphoetae TaxID=2049346 RepID=A0ABQ9YH13_9EUKA|nr:Multidrug resistance-associated protein [Blattamonas nauphoetae]
MSTFDPYTDASFLSKITGYYSKHAFNPPVDPENPRKRKKLHLAGVSFTKDCSDFDRLCARVRPFAKNHTIIVAGLIFLIPHVIFMTITDTINSLLQMIEPVLSHRFTRWGFDEKSPPIVGLFYACAIVAMSLLRNAIQVYTQPLQYHSHSRVRNVFNGLSIRKRFVLHPDIISNIDSEDLRRIASQDINSIQNLAQHLFNLLMVPTHLLANILTVRQLFKGTFSWTIIVSVLSLPLPTILVPKTQTIWKDQSKARNEYYKEVNNLTSNIKTIKINGWEDAIERKLLTLTSQMSNQDISQMRTRAFSTVAHEIRQILIMGTLFVENARNGVVVDALTLNTTLSQANTISYTLTNVLTQVAGIKHRVQAALRFEAYLQSSESDNNYQVDEKKYILIGNEWKTLSDEAKSEKIRHIDDTIAIDLNNCTLGYRMKRGTGTQKSPQLTSNPDLSAHIPDSVGDNPPLDDPDTIVEKGRSVPEILLSLIKRILRAIWDGTKLHFQAYFEDYSSRGSTGVLDLSCLQLSSLDFVPLAGRSIVHSSSPSFQFTGRSSVSPSPVAPISTRPQSPPFAGPPLVGPSGPRAPSPPFSHPSIPRAPSPAFLGSDLTKRQTVSPSARSTRSSRSNRPVLLAPVSFTLNLKHGRHYALLGTVGCGKSLLLSTLAGLSDGFSGEGLVNGVTVFLPQDPVVLNSTIRKNILFGLPLNKEVYLRVVDACCLNNDFDELPSADQEYIGEHGRKLSGGQKQRMCLARVCYSLLMTTPKSDDGGFRRVVLLDDPTSACDVKVTRQIEEKVLNGILKKETVLLTTHNKPLANRFGTVLEIVEGRIEYVKQEAEPEERNDDDEEEGTAKIEHTTTRHNFAEEGGDLDEMGDKAAESKSDQPQSELDAVDDGDDDGDTQDLDDTANPDDFMRAANSGKVTLSKENIIFMMKHFSVVLVAISYVVSFLAIWLKRKQQALMTDGSPNKNLKSTETTTEENNAKDTPSSLSSTPTTPAPTESTTQADAPIRVFTLSSIALHFFLSVATAGLDYSNSHLEHSMATANSKAMSSELLHIIMDTPWHIFEHLKNAVDSIIQHDVRTLTNPKSNPLLSFASQLQPLIVDVTSVFLKAPAFRLMYSILITWSLIQFVYYRLKDKWDTWKMRRKYAKQKKNEELDDEWDPEEHEDMPDDSYAASDHILTAGPTIRQMGQQDLFFKRVCDGQDDSTIYEFYENASESMYDMQYILTSGLERVMLWYFCSKAKKETGKGVSLAFLTTSAQSAKGVVGKVQSAYYSIRNSLSAVERVKRAYQLPQENGSLKREEGEEKEEEWMKDGRIELENVSVKYSTRGENILKGVSLSIESGQRIGIVGRTGCGKSTLTLAILNLLIRDSGTIKIGGTNINEIHTHTLRKHIAVVQQEVILANGSIRECIDPYHQHSDDAILRSLDVVGIKNDVLDLPDGINTPLTDTTRLLSAGQRQLLGISRALLKQAKIVLLDEPSSNVDQETDEQVQTVMREAWSDATVIVIAHRLTTVADTDVTVVMDKGMVLECGNTLELLQKEGSALQTLALNSGPAFLQQLQDIARYS